MLPKSVGEQALFPCTEQSSNSYWPARSTVRRSTSAIAAPGPAQEKGRILVRFDGGGEVEADLLVGADGVHSVVRSQLLGPARLSYRGYRVARGLTEAGSVPLPADAWETWGHGARFGLPP